CRGDSIALKPVGFNAQNITGYQWWYATGGDTSSNIKVAWQQSGAYTVQLVINNINGCSDTLTRVNYLHVNGPVAGFAPAGNSACLNKGGQIQFNDLTSTDGTHAIKNWQWNFGDNTSQQLAAPPFAHAYTKGGTYNVQLKVTDAAGCSDSISKANAIAIGDPKADFYSPDTTSCNNQVVHFVNNSTGTALNYYWRMGDGVNYYNQSPVHSYNHVGTFDVELRIWDVYGCRDSMMAGEYIHIDQPKAGYALSDSTGTCPPLIVQFTNQSSYYRRVDWDFGDGTGSQVENPIHYYNYPGTYYARLVITSPGGCTDTLVRKIVVKGPTGTFSYDKTIACTPGLVSFTAQTQNTASLVWDFNDGYTIKTPNLQVNHSFSALGIYVPKMILEDAQGCKVPIVGKDTISIYGVEPAFGSDKKLVCDAGLISFSDSSLSNDLIMDYEWHFGDGGVSYDQDPAHTYTAGGVYPVELTVTTLNGCKSTSSQVTNIKVAVSPQVSIRGDSSACAPATLNFSGASVVPDTSALSWQWNFGNGTTAAQQNPGPAQYQQAGNYPVVMNVTNSSGCVTTVTKPVFIHPVPLVNAGNDAVMCEKKTTQLHATGADTYTWSPSASLSCGNCATTLAAPDSNTLYRLHGETVFGCKADDSVLIRVKHPFNMKVGKGDTLCTGEVFQLVAGNAEMYDWTPSTGLDNNHTGTVLAKPGQTTTYQVIGHDSAGCFYDTGYIKLVVYAFPTIDAGTDKTIPVGSATGIKLKVSEDVNYIRWQPTTGLSCSNCTDPVVNPKQTTTYQITVMNQGGCVNKDEVSIFVVCNSGNVFLPNTFTPNGDGNNDVFYPRGTGLYTIRSMRIFNRWGEPVYEAVNFLANDATKGWTGKYKNTQAPNDVYVYFVEVVCENNAILTYSGNVALVR
ncbi:MAG TPA: PKD domain-containing protein, partial [Chitinophagaceae bacterium]|nr:PKD domain-containing protein [Chitinophagaceae bacterium]